MRHVIFALCLLGAAGLPAGTDKIEAKRGKQAASRLEEPGFYEKEGQYYAVGEAVHVVSSRSKAEELALKDAVERALKALEKKDQDKKRVLDQGTENGALVETQIRELKLGKAKIESVYQERWQAPEGKDAWNVKVMISIRRR